MKTGSRSTTRRCGGGCWRRGCGAGRGNAARIGGGGSGRRTSASWCRWTAVFTRGLRSAGPASCLLTLVDDATGRTLGRFGAQETIWAAVGVLRAWIAQYGIPQALYTDWKNVYVRAAECGGARRRGAVPLTQFGRMCATLGIRIIAASSPQAKGRVERNHGTHQDRLVKKLRRHGIADLDAANAFLATEYWADHNRALRAGARRRRTTFTRRVRAACVSTRCFGSRKRRTVSNDWVVRYDNRLLQLERQSGHPPARSTVLVCEKRAGQIEIRYRDRVMRWTEITAGADGTAATPRARAAHAAPRGAAPSAPAAGADHPWRQRIRSTMRARLAALGGRATR